MKVRKKVLFKAQKNRVRKYFLLFSIVFTILLGNETQVVAQELQQADDLSHVDFSNSIITTDCCPVVKQRIDSAMNNAPFVFEGRMIKKENGSMNDYFLFEVEKVYRGGERLQAGTVEVIVKYPQWQSSAADVPMVFSPRWHIIFAKEVEGGGAFDANNPIKLELVNDKVYNASCFWECAEQIYDNRGEQIGYRTPYYAGYRHLSYRTKQEVRDFISAYGLLPTDVPKADTLKILTTREIKRLEQENKAKSHYKTREEADSIIREIKRIRGIEGDSILWKNNNGKSQNKGHKAIGDPNFFLALDSVKNTNDGNNRFLEFDIMGRVDTIASYPEVIKLSLFYELDSLNMQGNNLQITLGNYFTTAGYNCMHVYDIDTNTNTSYIQVWMFVFDLDSPLIVMPTIETNLVHFKVNITGNIHETVDVFFADTITDLVVVKYNWVSIGYDPLDFHHYNIILPSPNVFTLPLSPTPVISNFYINTPGNKIGRAGCGDILVIQGNNFGNKNIADTSDIASTLAFKLGDYRTLDFSLIPYYKLQENYDYVLWTDTEIRVKLPSVAFKNDNSHLVIPGQIYPEQYPCTGQFKVITASGKEAVSSDSITIKYVWTNRTYQFSTSEVTKYPLYIPQKYCVNGFRFQVDSSIAADAAAIKCIKKALRDWSVALDIQLEFDTTISGNPIINTDLNPWAADKIHTISYTSTDNLGEPISLMTTCPHNSSRTPVYPSALEYVRDFDIGILNRGDWHKDTNNPGSNQYDFYTTILHELGHVIGLKHVANAGDLMTTVQDRGVKESLNANVLEGGRHIVSMSSDTTIKWKFFESEGDTIKVLNSVSTDCRIASLSWINTSCSSIFYDAIQVIWDNVPGATGYYLEYSSDSNFSSIHGSYYLAYNITSQAVTGLPQETTYYFRVIAYNQSSDLGYGTTNCEIEFTYVPNIDLYSRDNTKDNGTEHNPTENDMWNSPSIWIRNANDNGTGNQNPVGNDWNYVYIKVWNRGTAASLGTEKMILHWAKAATSLSWPTYWNGYRYQGVVMGDTAGVATIPVIQPGEYAIVEIPWFTPNPEDYQAFNTEPWHFCLMARIIAPYSDTMTYAEISDPNYNTRYNNNIVWRNVSILEINKKSLTATIAVRNAFAEARPVFLKFCSEESSKTIWQEAEITVKLDDILYNAWQRGGAKKTDIEEKGDNILLIRGENARLSNLLLETEEMGTLYLQFNFLTRQKTDQTDFIYHVVQTGEENGEEMVIGGEVYQISTSEDRDIFYANAGEDKYIFQNEGVMLSAADIGEPAIYKWYDQQGNLISEEREFDITVTQETKYKLEVIAEADGYKDYDEVAVKIVQDKIEPIVPGKIESIAPNPVTDIVKITCVFDHDSRAYFTVTNQIGRDIINHYTLNTSPQTVDMNISSYASGTYVVTLFCDGVIADTKRFVKQ